MVRKLQLTQITSTNKWKNLLMHVSRNSNTTSSNSKRTTSWIRRTNRWKTCQVHMWIRFFLGCLPLEPSSTPSAQTPNQTSSASFRQLKLFKQMWSLLLIISLSKCIWTTGWKLIKIFNRKTEHKLCISTNFKEESATKPTLLIFSKNTSVAKTTIYYKKVTKLWIKSIELKMMLKNKIKYNYRDCNRI